MSWDTIESDPGIFSTLLEDMGVRGVEVNEVIDLDALPPSCLGLLFLFQYSGSSKSPPSHLLRPVPAGSPTPWFARQTVQNACGTQALLHILLNNAASSGCLTLGETLTTFLGFTDGLPAADRGGCFEQCDAIRKAHNSFARPEPFIREEKVARPWERGKAPFHFLAYTACGGVAYELDGLAPSPACLGAPPEGAAAAAAGGGWLALARAAVQARIATSTEIRFSLLAVVEDARVGIARQAAVSVRALERQYGLLLSLGTEVDSPEDILKRTGLWPLPGEGVVPTPAQAAAEAAAEAAEEALDAAGLQAEYGATEAALEQCSLGAAAEREKRGQWERENAQRRHNFVPLIMGLLAGLAERGLLEAEYAKARERFKGRVERARREGRDVMDEDET
jgi:ubiquitin carboxyl-terminal hydrolase L5